MMTRQEIFTKVVTHLRKQGVKAVVADATGSTCMYRGPDGTKCAAAARRQRWAGATF